MQSFWEELHTQRWDDHRYYHQSRINQSLHFLSAMSFLVAYVMLFIDPVVSALIAWLISMVSRQSGHFFFEPKGYDQVNKATHEYKEEIKVGYNLKRKVILHLVWAAAPVALLIDPTFFGTFPAHSSGMEYLRHVGTLWLFLGIGGVAFRMLQLFFTKGVQSGLCWVIKIVTDPFSDVKLYWRAPFALMRGELIDPMDDVEEAESRA